MQIKYKKGEIVDINDLSNSLNYFVNKVKNHTIKKVAITNNNKPVAVMISTLEYERIKTISDMVK